MTKVQTPPGPPSQVKPAPALTPEEATKYSDAAKLLEKKYSVSKVHPVVQIHPDTFNRTVCFLKEPNYATKLRVMDKATTEGVYTAADELRVACLLREESDPITYGEGPECDDYKMGVTDYALTMVKRLQNQFKKK